MGAKLAAAALLALGVLSPAPAKAEDRVLLIGLSQWSDTRIQPLGQGAQADLSMMRHVARKAWKFSDRQIKSVLNKDATKANISLHFKNWLIGQTEPGDRVLIYVSGHGSRIPDISGDEDDDRLDEAFPLHDTALDDPNSFLSDDDFNNLIKQLPDRKITVILDTCHSGTATRGLISSQPSGSDDAGKPSVRFQRFPFTSAQLEKARTRGLARLNDLPDAAATTGDGGIIKREGNVVVWSAAAPDQLSWGDDVKGGVFTRSLFNAFTKGTADTNGDGTTSFAELLAVARKDAAAFCAKNPLGRPCPTPFTPMLEAPVELLSRDVIADQFRRKGDASEPAPVEATPQQIASLLTFSPEPGLKVEIVPGNTIERGREVRFRVTAPRDGQLILLDLDSKGKLIQLYPNAVCSKRGNHIAAGETITIPDKSFGCAFDAEGPNTGQVVAILADREADLSALTDANLELGDIAAGARYLDRLAVELSKVWFNPALKRKAIQVEGETLAVGSPAKLIDPSAPKPISWGTANVRYRIK